MILREASWTALDPAREVLKGILWILRTGASWKDLPERYPPYQTCHRRFQRWVRKGVMDEILRALAKDLKERGGLDLEECYIDGTFKKGGIGVGKTKRGKGSKLMAVADGAELPYIRMLRGC
jgi:transposase